MFVNLSTKPHKSALKITVRLGQCAAALLVTCFPLLATAQERAASNNGGCRLTSGHPILTRAAPTLPDIAAATYDRFTGSPVIYFNPWAVARLPPPFREFVHAHECAHHHLDHLKAGPVDAAGEAEADCWAAAELTAQGVLSPKDIALIGKVLTALLPGDRAHHAGHVRASELQRCVRYASKVKPEELASAPPE